MNSKQFILTTRIIGSEKLLEKHGYSSLSIIQQRHEALVIPIIEMHGKVVHNGINGLICIFSNPVFAVAASVKIQRAHHIWKEGPTPPSISISIVKGTIIHQSENIVLGSGIKLGEKIVKIGGSGEIIISRKIGELWKEKGNRKLHFECRIIKINNKKTKFRILHWDTKTHEPKIAERKRGSVYSMMILIPSFVTMLLMGYFLFKEKKQINNKILIYGPFHSPFSTNFCEKLNFKKPSDKIKIFKNCSSNIYSGNLPKGSIQITGRIRRAGTGYILTAEIINLNDGKLAFRLTKKIKIISNLKNEIYDLSNKLLEKYGKIFNEEDLFQLASICGVSQIPPYEIFAKGKQIDIKFKTKLFNENFCLKELILNRLNSGVKRE
jgi:hypothetical protein